MEPEGSLTALTSARHLSLSWASPIQSTYPHPTSWRSILLLYTHLRLGLPSGLFPSGFPTKTLYTPLSSPIRATCPAHLILTIYNMWSFRDRFPLRTRYSARPDRPWGPLSLLQNGYRFFPVGLIAVGACCWPLTPFWCRGHGRVELYLYPPSGPHRASNGITLPLFYIICDKS